MSKVAKKKKWKVEISRDGFFNGLYQVWDKNGNQPKNDEAMRRRIEKLLNNPTIHEQRG